ncbi:MAG: NAD(P)-binding domain-containing protein [Myxococcales bacterium]|nr:NAD(P)-binding domain-containing protein [Myxococcales bacterium]
MPALLCVGLIVVFFVIPSWIWIEYSERKTRRQRDAAAKAGRNQPVTIQPFINLGTCMGSGACVTACPEDVLKILDGQAIAVNMSACVGHGVCVTACPVDAIELVFGSEKRGIAIPQVGGNFETNVPGLFVAGELGGMGLIANAADQGVRAMQYASEGLRSQGNRTSIAIVGAGPAGIAAALSAKERDLDFLLFEQEEVGGAILHFPRKKLVFTRPMNLPMYGSVKTTSMVKEQLVSLFQDVVEQTGLDVCTQERVDAVDKLPDGGFRVVTAKREIEAQRVILTLGRRGTPRTLRVPGEQSDKVSYSLLEPEHYQYDHILVVGGGDSAVEAACTLGEQEGNKVTLSYRGAKINRPKQKNVERLRDAIRSRDVELLLESNVAEIGEDRVVIDQLGEQVVIPNDYVFVFVGGVLPTEFLKKAGVQIRTHFGKRIEEEKPADDAPAAAPPPPPPSDDPPTVALSSANAAYDDAGPTLALAQSGLPMDALSGLSVGPSPASGEPTVVLPDADALPSDATQRLGDVDGLLDDLEPPPNTDAPRRGSLPSRPRPRGGPRRSAGPATSPLDVVPAGGGERNSPPPGEHTRRLPPEEAGVPGRVVASKPAEPVASLGGVTFGKLPRPDPPTEINEDLADAPARVRPDATPGEHAARTAKEQEQAGNARRALDLYHQAGREQIKGNEHAAAFEVADQMQALVDRRTADVTARDRARAQRQVHQLRGEAHLGLAEWDLAIQPLEHAVSDARSGGSVDELGSALLLLGRAFYRSGQFGRAASVLDEAERTWRPGPAKQTQLLRLLADLSIRRGELDAAERMFDDARTAAKKARSEHDVAKAHRGLAHVRAFRGDLAGSLELLGQADASLARDGDPRVRAGVLCRLLELDTVMGQFETALDRADTLLEMVRQDGLEYSRPEVAGLLAEALMMMGSRQDALEAADDAVSMARSLGPMVDHALVRAARVYCELSEFDRASRVLRGMAEATESEIDDPVGQRLALRARVTAASDPSRGRRLAERVVSRPLPMLKLRGARLRLDASRALIDADQNNAARSIVKEGLKLVQSTGATGLRFELLLAFHTAVPDHRVAEAAGRTAQKLLERMPDHAKDSFVDRTEVKEVLRRWRAQQ